MFNLQNFYQGNEAEYLFDIYLQEKYGLFDEEGYPIYDIDDIKQSLSPEKLAAEKLGFLIFKDAYKAAMLSKYQKLVDDEKARALAAAGGYNTGGGGGSGGGGDYTSGGGGYSGGGVGGWSTGWWNDWMMWSPTKPKTGIEVKDLGGSFVNEQT